MNKKGISMNIDKTIQVVIGIVILFALMAQFIPEVQTQGDALNDTGAPFANFFASDGIAILLLMVALLLVVVGVVKYKKGR